MMKAMKPAMMNDAIMMIIMVTDMVMMGLAMVMVEMDLEPRKAVNMDKVWALSLDMFGRHTQ
jgi:hypothetical protein